MTDDSNLSNFGIAGTPPPLVERKRIVQSPHTGKIAGFIGKEKRRDYRAYTTLRTGFHYYYDGGGWAISDSILDIIEEVGVSRIYVHEGTERDDDVHEFTARQYLDHGTAVPEPDLYDEDDPQTYVEEEERIHKWEDHAVGLFQRTFEDALDEIEWRGYDADLKKRKQAEQEDQR
jgi:hypothetical protein